MKTLRFLILDIFVGLHTDTDTHTRTHIHTHTHTRSYSDPYINLTLKSIKSLLTWTNSNQKLSIGQYTKCPCKLCKTYLARFSIFWKKHTFFSNLFSWTVRKTVSEGILFGESTPFSAKKRKFLPLKISKIIEIFSMKIIISSIN